MCVEDMVVHFDTGNGDVNLLMWAISGHSAVVTAAAPNSIEDLCHANSFRNKDFEQLNKNGRQETRLEQYREPRAQILKHLSNDENLCR